ncbi:transmembrane protein [Ceratobasidium sp. AG-Ba]|nr:transmembrane protein [Ceratobasidium sp. AG-Ba]
MLAERSLAFKGPSSVNVLNYTSDGLWCEVAGAAAVDASLTLGLSSRKFTDRLVGWAIRRVGSVTVSTHKAHIYSSAGIYLATVHLPDVTLPLATKSPAQLEHLTLRLLVQLTRNNQDLLDFVSRSWEASSLKVRVDLSEVGITGGRKTHRFSWKNRLHVIKHDVRAAIQLAIPPMPGMPSPPPNEPRPIPDFASLVYLQSYRVLPPPPTLRIVGTATLPNPIPSLLQGTVALTLPFIVSLPPAASSASLPVARVETAPLALTTPNISLAFSGQALALPSTSNSIAPVSRFASDFLAARSSPILITTDFLRDVGMQEELTIHAEFPAAAERPELLRDVQISDMRISLRGEQIFASAFVRAHIVPPDTLSALRINATRVWPDLLVYDGPAPSAWPFDNPGVGSPSGVQYDERWSEPEPMPLPKPLPPTAFARIRPESWIPAHTEVVEEQEGVWVHAQVTDVPLEVLPGRDSELRRFISKVLFNMNGARAGVAGISAVAARVGGLMIGDKESGELELFALPLRGETWVGKKHLNEPEWNIPVPSNPLPLPPIPTPSLPLPEPHLPHLPHLPEIKLPIPTHSPSTPKPEIEEEPEPEIKPEPNRKPESVTEDPEEYYWPTYGGGMASGYAEELEATTTGELWQVGVAY